MDTPSKILYEPDWNAIIAGLAFLISLFNLWYSAFRRGRLCISASRWTVIGAEANGKLAATFVLKIDVINTGSQPILLKDLFLEAETFNGKRIYYDPIILFDLTYYYASIGQDAKMSNAQKGMVPLPIGIPAGKHIDFGYEMLFMPHDKKTAVDVATGFPIRLRLFASTGRNKGYQEIANQKITADDVAALTSGGFSGVLSSASIDKRNDFFNRSSASSNEKTKYP